ncbi:MAG: hypothetical protein JRE64_06725 [Deltaproteobacteria bacterium]|nr:hypothetical protein [Deltaproteobacteria bacterium]
MNANCKKFMASLGFLGFLITILIVIPSIVIIVTPGQSKCWEQMETFYYSFDKKIYGRLDTSILALQVPKGMERTELNSTVSTVKGEFLSEEIPYVKAFQQEGISFVKLEQPIDTIKSLKLFSTFSSVSPKVRAGHPFFIEGGGSR